MEFSNTEKSEKKKKAKDDIKNATTQAQRLKIIEEYLGLK